MIPYVELPSFKLGPFTIEIFGIFAALGIYTAARIAAGRAAKQGLDPAPLADFAVWGVIGGILGGHLVHLFFYHPEELRDPWRILKVWDGLSSFGGLLGGVLVAAWFFRSRNLRLSTYGDALALGIAPGWGIARLGCFAVHDHPGRLTSSPLAVAFPGGARFDLGLFDAVWLFAIAAVLFTLARRGALRGRLLAVLAVLYGIGRFYFDFLRARDLSYVDARYLGLTPAQYFCFLIVGWGLYQLFVARGPAGSSDKSVAGGDSAVADR